MLRLPAVISLSAVLFLFGLASSGHDAGASPDCLPAGAWGLPTAKGVRPLPRPPYAEWARSEVVLLGESHDSAEHHRWQLQVLAAMHAIRPKMSIGFEMFPRRVQAVLDRWVAGELSTPEFLKQVEWSEVWGFDPQLYLPLFHFARMNRIPMLALNVDNGLVKEVGANGWAGIPEHRREGVSSPAPAAKEYEAELLETYRQHPAQALKAGTGGAPTSEDPGFRRFVEAQLLRDRAMAEGIANALARTGRPLVVGIMGAGHVRNGYGVPSQLRALGVERVTTLLPLVGDCRSLGPELADAVFGVETLPAEEPGRPRMGVRLSDATGGARIEDVVRGSPAEAAGLKVGDLIRRIAGSPVKRSVDVAAAVGRQPPGTWLPLEVEREGQGLEKVVKFPSAAP
jgi:uncharacterized iron-regulated protein